MHRTVGRYLNKWAHIGSHESMQRENRITLHDSSASFGYSYFFYFQ